jgi:hypothetical protein
MIVATHWHNDHVRGLSDIVQRCPDAEFLCSSALFRNEFLALAELWDELEHSRSAVSELYRVIKHFERLGHAANGRIKFAGPNRRIRHRTLVLKGSKYECEIFSLSPSDHEILRSYQVLAALLPHAGDRPLRPLPVSPNDTSVVLSVRSGSANVLLGADLEEQGQPNTGWQVIVNSQERPQTRASAFKVPHHGSQNGDYPCVWSEMLDKNPFAILTPFKAGRIPLPQPADVARICGYTTNTYITALPKQRTHRSRSGASGKTMFRTVRRIWNVDDSVSRITMRRSLIKSDDVWRIVLRGEAQQLQPG